MSRRIKKVLLTPRGAAVAIFTVALVGAALLWIRPYFTTQRTFIASEPAPTGLDTLQHYVIGPHDTACMTEATLPRTLGQISVTLLPVGGQPLPPVAITLSGAGYTTTTTSPAGFPGGTIVLPLHPPKRTVIGNVCFTDIGKSEVALLGSNEPHSATRSTLVVDGKPTPGEIAITLLTPGFHPLAEKLVPVAEHVSNLFDRLFGPYVLLILGGIVLFGLPVLVGFVLWWALSGS